MILESYMNNNIDFMLRESNELLQENKFTEGIKKDGKYSVLKLVK